MRNWRVFTDTTDKGSVRVRSQDRYGKFHSHYCVEKSESAMINGKLLVGKTLANAYVKIVEGRYHKNELGDVDLSLPIGELMDDFIEERWALKFSSKTIMHSEQSFAAFLRETSARLLADLTNDLLRKWTIEMSQQKLSVHTVTNRLSDIRTWLNWLKERGKIKESPFGLKMMPMKKEPEIRFFTTEEFKALDEALIQSHPSTYVACHLAHSTGVRHTEAMGVRWEDISWLEEGAEILIRKEVAKGKKRSRTIPMDAGLLEILGSRKVGLLAPFDNEWQLWHFFDKAREKAGINPELTFHGLRHTFAKNYLQRGQGNLASLQKLLGHASIVSTMVYAQFEKSYLREGIDRAYERRMQDEAILKLAKEA